MLSDRLEMIISSCNNYSDLWDLHVWHLNKYWSDRTIKSTIVTDEKTNCIFSNVDVFAAGSSLEMPQRLKKMLNTISSEYVLITLDDYFITQNVDNLKINSLLEAMDEYELDYVRMFPIPKEKIPLDRQKKLYWVDLSRNYAVNLYPGIWRKSFLEETLKESLNAWMYEVSLTSIAKETNRKCVMSRGNEFVFLDVIRKGKLLSKASKYLKSNGMIINREVISKKEEAKLDLMFWTKKNMPRCVQSFVKKIMSLFGMRFFSDGI